MKKLNTMDGEANNLVNTDNNFVNADNNLVNMDNNVINRESDSLVNKKKNSITNKKENNVVDKKNNDAISEINNSVDNISKSIIFDAGPIISLTTNNLLWLLDVLKQDYKGDFYIPAGVKTEIIDYPLKTKKFKFEALQVSEKLRKGILSLIETPQIKALAEELQDLLNHTFKVRGSWVQVVQYGEMETLAAAIILNAEAVVIDERTTRVLIEEPERLLEILRYKMRGKVTYNEKNIKKFKTWAKNLKVIRSIEIVTIAYEKGHLDKYLLNTSNARRTLIESILWGVKLHGCSVTRDEIEDIVRMEQ